MNPRETIRSLIAARAATWEQAKALLDSVDDTRDMTGEEQTEWDTMNGDIARFDVRIAEMEDLIVRNDAAVEAAERYSDAAPVTSDVAPGDVDVLRAMARGETRAAEFSVGQGEERAITVGGDGGLVPTGFVNQLVSYLQENAALVGAGATILRTTSGEAMTVPRITAHPSAAIIAEAVAITASDPTTGSVTLNAYKYAFLTQVSTEFLTDEGVDIVAYLARIGGQALGNGFGGHVATGTGAGQPKGIVTAATTGKTGAAGNVGAPQATELIDLQHSVIAPYRGKASTGFCMSDTTLAGIRKLQDSNNQFLWSPGLTAGAPSTILGDKVVVDPNIADAALSAKSVIYGDLSGYFARFSGAIRVERSDDYAFNTDQATWRFIMRADGDLIDANSLKLYVGNAA